MNIENKMTLQNHLEELRKRIIFSVIFFFSSFCICYFYAEEIYQFLLQPFSEVFLNNKNQRLIYTSPAEAFLTYLKLSFYSSLFFSFPVFASQFYFFISPGLYKNEKNNILLILFFCPFLFLLGAFLAYFLIIPIALKFFAGFQLQGSATSLSIHLETRISEYLQFVINLLFGFGIAFQLPIMLLFLIKVGVLSAENLKRTRKYWIVIIFIIAAILTPPDVLSQLSLAIPMMFLFEIAVLISKNCNNKK